MLHPDDVRAYLGRLYAESGRQWACRATTPAAFGVWQEEARDAFRDLLGLSLIEVQGGRVEPRVEWAYGVEDLGQYTRQRGWLDTEPAVRTSFWCLRPKWQGPFPLAVTPHGHENGDIYDCCDYEDLKAGRQLGSWMIEWIKRLAGFTFT